ncbi:hypothetical protein [Streptomyces sp. NPDC056255]|uniref:hypothetical protein n=1 Tax=Streptomyces sp. NPDC056255 TaxID=3345764 RepID=UPI0035E31A03
MSIVIKFFLAPHDEAATAVVDRGPDGVFDSLVFGNFDATEAMIEWEGIFTGHSFDELVDADEPRVVADPGNGEGPMLFVASRALHDALAIADQPKLAEVSELWVRERAADGEGIDPDVAAGILGDLAKLARSSGGGNDRLYCWLA